MNMSNNEERILNYLGDKILSNRWKEYEKIHLLIMRSELNKDEYLDMCDKLRELEKEIETTLNGRSLAISRREMYKDIIDRDKRTLERTQ
jgi:hypothetical protein